MALYVVSTPIGNLGDMTFRGVEVLRQVSLILAEDTRRTRTLLTRFDISRRRRPRITSTTRRPLVRGLSLGWWLVKTWRWSVTPARRSCRIPAGGSCGPRSMLRSA